MGCSKCGRSPAIQSIVIGGATRGATHIVQGDDLKTVMYVGSAYGSSAVTVNGRSYVFGGNQSHRVNTMSNDDAETLVSWKPHDYLILPDVEVPQQHKMIKALSAKVMQSRDIDLEQKQRVKLASDKIFTVGAMLCADVKTACKCIGVTQSEYRQICDEAKVMIGLDTASTESAE